MANVLSMDKKIVVIGAPKPKKIGRPKLPKGQAKGKIVALRFDAEKQKIVEAAARSKNLSVSGWIRGAIDAAL